MIDKFILIVLFQFCFIYGIIAQSPTQECMQSCSAGNGRLLLFCGTDNSSYVGYINTSYSTIDYRHCMEQTCGVNILYAGTCQCPNDCFRGLGRGWCNTFDPSSPSCSCSSSFTGIDCGTIACPYSCMGRGVCIDGTGTCQCQDGWTGNDCSIPMFTGVPYLPYGQIFPHDEEYQGTDPYGDAHPIFNLTMVAQGKISIPPSKLVEILTPYDMADAPWKKTDSFEFLNPAIQTSFEEAGLDIYGQLSRQFLKKSWKLDFTRYTNASDLFPTGLRHMAFKADRNGFQCEMMVELYRAWPVPTQRGGYLQLWINSVYVYII